MFSRHSSLSFLHACAAAVLFALGATAAHADSAYSLHLAQGKTYQRLTLNWESGMLWSRPLGETGRLELAMELGLSAWQADAGREPRRLAQFSAVPLWRWWPSQEARWFVEAGVGPSLLSSSRFADRRLSTAFQFADHLGLGFAVDRDTRLGLRVSHFSNASIKRPNPGLDIYQLTVWRRF